MAKRHRILRTIVLFVVAAGVLEAGAYGVWRALVPPKWTVQKNNRLAPYAGVIDYSDVVKGRGARLGRMTVNKLGTRGREAELANERGPGRLRVYCVGASTTFGWGASDDDATYPAQLERCLKELLPNENVEVINGGIPGIGAHAQMRNLREDLPRLKPDVVLWCGTPDWLSYLHEDPAKKSGGQTLTEAAAALMDAIQARLENTSAFRLGVYLRDSEIPRPDPPSEEELARRPGVGEYNTESLERFRTDLAALIELCKREGAMTIVAGIATPLRHPPAELSPAARRQSASRLAGYQTATREDLHHAISAMEDTIAAVAKNAGVIYADPGQLPDDAELFIDGFHMNDDGYAALAKSMAPIVTSCLKAPQ